MVKKNCFQELDGGAFVETSNRNHRKLHLYNNIKIFNKFKILKHHQIGNFRSNIDLRRQDILSQGNTHG